ncbi:MAG: hypothetical protein IT462_03695 [Planctomycetes bacterium]|nr:hypothetical protein [Planctomycetota bacterium]
MSKHVKMQYPTMPQTAPAPVPDAAPATPDALDRMGQYDAADALRVSRAKSELGAATKHAGDLAAELARREVEVSALSGFERSEANEALNKLRGEAADAQAKALAASRNPDLDLPKIRNPNVDTTQGIGFRVLVPGRSGPFKTFGDAFPTMFDGVQAALAAARESLAPGVPFILESSRGYRYQLGKGNGLDLLTPGGSAIPVEVETPESNPLSASYREYSALKNGHEWYAKPLPTVPLYDALPGRTLDQPYSDADVASFKSGLARRQSYGFQADAAGEND